MTTRQMCMLVGAIVAVLLFMLAVSSANSTKRVSLSMSHINSAKRVSLPVSRINRMSLASGGGQVLPYSTFAPLCDKAKAMAQRMTGSSRGVFVVIVSPAEGN